MSRSSRPPSRRGRAAKTIAALVVVASATFVVPTVWGKPWSIRHFYLRALAHALVRSPQLCTQLHLLDWRADQLDDDSVAARTDGNDVVRRELGVLHRYDRASMSPDEQTSYDVMDFFLVTSADRDSGLTGDSPYAIDQLDGVHVSLPDFLTNQHDVESKSDAEHYLARLGHVGEQFDQVIATANDDASHGIVPPKFVLARVEADVRSFTAPPSADNPLVTTFRTKLAGAKGIDEAAQRALVDRAIKALDDVVKPAYARYLDAVVALGARATDDAGLWHTTGGDARYARYLRLGTASDLTPDEVHAMGLAEVARIEDQMRAVLGPLGLPTDAPASAIVKLHDEPRFQFPMTPDGRTQILARYQAILDDIHSKLGRMTTIALDVPMKVEAVPSFKEKTAPGAYYEPPPLDDSKPGIFYANLSIPQFAFDMRTLAYHEGIPGHHFQIMTARHQKDLPIFRQLIPFNSYVEGWALWAEQVAADQGFEDDPYDRLGFLAAQLFRATRLVVDTGLHAKRWTREQAIAYFREHSAEDDKGVTIEVERYIVWPGQACGYMVGKKTIEGLAEKAKAKLGPRYDVRAFDDVVLRAGAVPLPVLRTIVERWLAAQPS